MSDTPLDDIKKESAQKGKDSGTRTLLLILLALWLVTLLALIGVGWNAYFSEKQKTQTLAQQLSLACQSGELGDGISEEVTNAVCNNAERVIDNENVAPSIPGPQGPAGPQGPPGYSGQDGDDGQKGLSGKRGAKGKAGATGKEGPDGFIGPMGPQGPPGEIGPSGPPGPQGETGAKGDTGPQGDRGLTGVVTVDTVNCEGPIISSVSLSYDAQTQTITLTCTN